MLLRAPIRPLLIAIAGATLALATASCSNNEDAYKATPAYSGRKPNIPPVPALPTTPIKVGDTYTVYGAGHQLRSQIHSAEVAGKEITITGYIVRSNIGEAPACAAHAGGKADPPDCKDIPIPTFWIADNKGDTKGQTIQVLGWAHNFSTVFDAMAKYKNVKDTPKEMFKDDEWQVDVPYPLPAAGAKVKVTGKYAYTFTKSATGMVSDPVNGVLSYTHMETIEPPTAPAAFATK